MKSCHKASCRVTFRSNCTKHQAYHTRPPFSNHSELGAGADRTEQHPHTHTRTQQKQRPETTLHPDATLRLIWKLSGWVVLRRSITVGMRLLMWLLRYYCMCILLNVQLHAFLSTEGPIMSRLYGTQRRGASSILPGSSTCARAKGAPVLRLCMYMQTNWK